MLALAADTEGPVTMFPVFPLGADAGIWTGFTETGARVIFVTFVLAINDLGGDSSWEYGEPTGWVELAGLDELELGWLPFPGLPVVGLPGIQPLKKRLKTRTVTKIIKLILFNIYSPLLGINLNYTWDINSQFAHSLRFYKWAVDIKLPVIDTGPEAGIYVLFQNKYIDHADNKAGEISGISSLIVYRAQYYMLSLTANIIRV
jgi:hypothetical protein